jgi:hypothetical protein
MLLRTGRWLGYGRDVLACGIITYCLHTTVLSVLRVHRSLITSLIQARMIELTIYAYIIHYSGSDQHREHLQSRIRAVYAEHSCSSPTASSTWNCFRDGIRVAV